MHFSKSSRRTISSGSESRRRLLTTGQVIVLGSSVPALMRLPLPRVARLLEPSRSISPAVDVHGTIERVLPLVDGALRRGRPFVRTGCLTRGVTRYWFLRRAGVEVELVFGTGRVDGKIEAHCWLTLDGVPLREPDREGPFSTLVRICPRGLLVAAS